MTYEDAVTCYRAGAANPDGVAEALAAMEEFKLRFNELYFDCLPENAGEDIFKKLAEAYLTDFLWLKQ